MNKTKATGMTRYLPNIASFTRIFGTLVLPFLMWDSWGVTLNLPLLGVFTNVPLVWVIVYLFLVLTDNLDGMMARRLQAESELGATLDAIGDAILLVVSFTCVFAWFARPGLSTFQFWFFLIIMVQILSDKVVVYIISKRQFGAGNMLHSIPHKAFAVGAYLLIAYWAFTRSMQTWSILVLWAIMTYAFVDELFYIRRAATYNVDFKGHGFEKYELRKNQI